MVAGQLAKLARKDPRWRYLQAIPVGVNGSDIDHLAIGPGGVFGLNAKHHPGSNVWVGGNTLMINGQRQPYIRNSRHEAQRAGKLLTAACGFHVPVIGMVVPVGADWLLHATGCRNVISLRVTCAPSHISRYQRATSPPMLWQTRHDLRVGVLAALGLPALRAGDA